MRLAVLSVIAHLLRVAREDPEGFAAIARFVVRRVDRLDSSRAEGGH